MHECFLKHSPMGTVGMKLNKETVEEGKKRGMSMERSKAGSRRPITTKSKYKNNKYYMVLLYKIWKNTMKFS